MPSRAARVALGTTVGLAMCGSGCAGRPEPVGTLPPPPVPAWAPRSAAAAVPSGSGAELHAVSRVVRHWFGRYAVRYSDIVRIETLIAHIDAPSRADAFVVATFTDTGSVDSRGRPIVDRPHEGRYYRAIQLRLRSGRWQIESVQPT